LTVNRVQYTLHLEKTSRNARRSNQGRLRRRIRTTDKDKKGEAAEKEGGE